MDACMFPRNALLILPAFRDYTEEGMESNYIPSECQSGNEQRDEGDERGRREEASERALWERAISPAVPKAGLHSQTLDDDVSDDDVDAQDAKGRPFSSPLKL